MRALAYIALLGATAASAAIQGPQIIPSRDAPKFKQWMAEGGHPLTEGVTFRDGMQKALNRGTAWAESWLADHGVYAADVKANKDNVWQFLPTKVANLVPGQEESTWDGIGCKSGKGSAVYSDDTQTSLKVHVEVSGCGLLAGDLYLLATMDGFQILETGALSKTHDIDWKINSTSDGNKYDMAQKGVRVLRFPQGAIATVTGIVATAQLFLQPLTGTYPDYPSDDAMEANVNFLTDYTQIPPFMTKRSTRNVTEIDESLVQTGDFIGIVRLDGLDPMLGWAMGSTTGHTTIAMRDQKNGTLYVCEAQTVSAYWPKDGVQCTEWKEWLEYGRLAGYNAVWAPLDPARREKLNVTAMWEFFHANEGFEYGYHTLLWGWIDTVANNYPCAAPDYKKSCLTWDVVELLFANGGALLDVFKMIFVDALNKRVGTDGLSVADVIYRAETVLNIPREEVPTIVEQDAWVYNTTRYGKPAVGKSMVCCVFVCSMWKAGGLFGDDEVNCGELTNLDVYSLGVFDKAQTGENRPAACKNLDPDNELCQLMGPYTLNLNHFNEAASFAHMAEKCPSWNPGTGPNYWPDEKKNSQC